MADKLHQHGGQRGGDQEVAGQDAPTAILKLQRKTANQRIRLMD